MELSKRIRDLRYAKGWGPDELASRAKISRTALYQIERGNTSKPQAGTLRRISRALGVPLEILLDSTPVLAEQTPSSEGACHGSACTSTMISGSLELVLLVLLRGTNRSKSSGCFWVRPWQTELLGSSKNRSVCCRSSFACRTGRAQQKLRAVAGHRHATQGPGRPRITTSE